MEKGFYILIGMILAINLAEGFFSSRCGYSSARRVKFAETSMMAVHQISLEECKRFVSRSEVIFMVPTASINMQSMTKLRKALPVGVIADVIPPNNVLQSIDGTPFVTLAKHIGGRSHLYIFAQKGKGAQPDFVNEVFFKWARTASRELSSPTYCFAARKSHLLQISLGPKKDTTQQDDDMLVPHVGWEETRMGEDASDEYGHNEYDDDDDHDGGDDDDDGEYDDQPPAYGDLLEMDGT